MCFVRQQEQCRVKSYDGREALIRSFPSKLLLLPLRAFNWLTLAFYVCR